MRISQEIGNLMKEIETLVEEKTKESLDVSRLTREGERKEKRRGMLSGCTPQASLRLGQLALGPSQLASRTASCE